MKETRIPPSTVILTLALVFLVVCGSLLPAQPVQDNPAPAAPGGFDEYAALTALEKSIAGHENDPSEKVFKNIKILTGVPAGRLLKVMELGYSDSLGVTCTFCHDLEHWDSDAKVEKKTARGMALMVTDLNRKILPVIDGLGDKTPMVNCTTCHRGQTKPALSLDEPSH